MSSRNSRFGFNAVPPPISNPGGMQTNPSGRIEPLKTSNSSFAHPRQKNDKLKNYFDDDDDDDDDMNQAPSSSATSHSIDDYDPLDAFMSVKELSPGLFQ